MHIIWALNNLPYKLLCLLLEWEGKGKQGMSSGLKNPAFFACHFDAVQGEKLLYFGAIFGPFLNEPFFFLS